MTQDDTAFAVTITTNSKHHVMLRARLVSLSNPFFLVERFPQLIPHPEVTGAPKQAFARNQAP